MSQDINRELMIDFLSESIRYVKSVEKYNSCSMLQPMQAKRMVSATSRMIKKINKMAEDLGVEFIAYDGSVYSAELPVEALNLEDFDSNANLLVVGTVEPTIKEKGSSHILKYGKVMVGEQ